MGYLVCITFNINKYFFLALRVYGFPDSIVVTRGICNLQSAIFIRVRLIVLVFPILLRPVTSREIFVPAIDCYFIIQYSLFPKCLLFIYIDIYTYLLSSSISLQSPSPRVFQSVSTPSCLMYIWHVFESRGGVFQWHSVPSNEPLVLCK